MKLSRVALGWILVSTTLTAGSALLADEPVQFTVIGIDCEACAPPILKALKALPDVKNPKLDWKAGTATVEVPAGYDREKIRTAPRTRSSPVWTSPPRSTEKKSTSRRPSSPERSPSSTMGRRGAAPATCSRRASSAS